MSAERCAQCGARVWRVLGARTKALLTVDDPSGKGVPRLITHLGPIGHSCSVITPDGRIVVLAIAEQVEGWTPHWRTCRAPGTRSRRAQRQENIACR